MVCGGVLLYTLGSSAGRSKVTLLWYDGTSALNHGGQATHNKK